MAVHYKEAKEAFVSQLEGGSIYKINIVSLTALTTYSLWACLRSRGILVSTSNPSSSIHKTRADWNSLDFRIWFVEVAVLVVPIILGVTILSNHLIALNGAISLACYYVLYSYPAPKKVEKSEKKGHKQHWSKKDSDDEEDDLWEEQELTKNKLTRHVATPSEEALRISVDSAADSAFASAAPPTQFIPPGVDEGSYSNHSSRISSETGHGLTGLGLQQIDHERSYTSSNPTSPLRNSSSLSNTEAIPPIPAFSLQPDKKSTISNYVPRNQPFLSVYRAHMMLMTIVCILAVDFQAFPREFAKCETWGTSLMDLGVGSFVFSMGIVSASPLLRSPSQRFKPLRAQLLRDAKRSIPLLLLGGVRVIMVKGVEYPEHVSEYGVHWNFFITLALLPFFGTLCRPLTKIARFSVLGLGLSCIHQLVLSFTQLGPWTTSNSVPRNTLLTQNKEGIVSFPGYLALFLLGLDLGHYVLPRDPYLAYRKASKSRKQEKTDKLGMLLASFSILWWAAYYLDSLLLVGQASRRLANLAYVLWVTAYNSTFLLCYVLIYMILLQPLEANGKGKAEDGEEALQESKTPLLLSSLNYAAFIVFLIANLLTGLINVSIQTMYTSHYLAITILILYTSSCLALATYIHLRGWKLPI